MLLETAGCLEGGCVPQHEFVHRFFFCFFDTVSPFLYPDDVYCKQRKNAFKVKIDKNSPLVIEYIKEAKTL